MPIFEPERYVVTIGTGSGSGLNPADASTYYWGQSAGWGNPSTIGTGLTVHLPYVVQASGRVVSVTGFIYALVPGSTHTVTLDLLRVGDGSTAGVASTVALNVNPGAFENHAMNFAVARGDQLLMKLITPTWSTNPTNTFYTANVCIEVP